MNFQPIANADPAPFLAAIKPEMFNELTFRQDTPGSPHPNSETIFIQMPTTISYHSIFEEMACVGYPAAAVFGKLVTTLLRDTIVLAERRPPAETPKADAAVGATAGSRSTVGGGHGVMLV